MRFFKDLTSKLYSEITEIPEILKASYYPSLNGLRAVAVCIVLFAHFSISGLIPNVVSNGVFGVHIFFVLSGFLITTLLMKEKLKHGEISLKRFYIRRAFRILPVAYIFLIVLIILNIYFNLGIHYKSFVSSFFFYKNMPYQEEIYSGHFWSLAAEIQFYLIFPYLLALNTNRYLSIVLFTVIAVPVIALLGGQNVHVAHPTLISRLINYIVYFFWKGPYIILLGSLFSLLLFKGVIRIDKNKTKYFLSTFLFIISLTITSESFLFYVPILSECVASILIVFVIFLELSGKSFLSIILENAVVVKIGVISYSIYIWQQLFSGGNYWEPWLKPFQHLSPAVLLLPKLIVVFLISLLSYYFFEVKFLKIKNRFE